MDLGFMKGFLPFYGLLRIFTDFGFMKGFFTFYGFLRIFTDLGFMKGLECIFYHIDVASMTILMLSMLHFLQLGECMCALLLGKRKQDFQTLSAFRRHTAMHFLTTEWFIFYSSCKFFPHQCKEDEKIGKGG